MYSIVSWLPWAHHDIIFIQYGYTNIVFTYSKRSWCETMQMKWSYLQIVNTFHISSGKWMGPKWYVGGSTVCRLKHILTTVYALFSCKVKMHDLQSWMDFRQRNPRLKETQNDHKWGYDVSLLILWSFLWGLFCIFFLVIFQLFVDCTRVFFFLDDFTTVCGLFLKKKKNLVMIVTFYSGYLVSLNSALWLGNKKY